MKNINVSAIALMLSLLVVAPVVASDKPKTDGASTSAPQSKGPQQPAGDQKPNVSNDGTTNASTGSTTAPAASAGFFANLKASLGSAYASVKSASSTALNAAWNHPFYTAAGVAVVGTALYLIVKNSKQIKKAVLNNPIKSLGVVAGLGILGYAYKAGYFSKAPATTTKEELQKTQLELAKKQLDAVTK
jgi:hypothetical protein